MKTFVSALLLIALGTPALGAAGESSAVVPYPVKGRTAREIYDDIKLNAPRIAPNATFAFTAMATKTVKAHKVMARAVTTRASPHRSSTTSSFRNWPGAAL